MRPCVSLCFLVTPYGSFCVLINPLTSIWVLMGLYRSLCILRRRMGLHGFFKVRIILMGPYRS